jgi:hypothetical protein
MNARLKAVPTSNTQTRAQLLDQLASEIDIAKRVEREATARRHAAEEQIRSLIDGEPESTAREQTPNFTIKVERKVTRSWDTDTLSAVYAEIPEAIRERLIRTKYEVEVRELRYIENNEPAVYAIIAAALVTKPSKPAVTVEPIG